MKAFMVHDFFYFEQKDRLQEVAKGHSERELPWKAWMSNFAWGKFAATLIQGCSDFYSLVRHKGSHPYPFMASNGRQSFYMHAYKGAAINYSRGGGAGSGIKTFVMNKILQPIRILQMVSLPNNKNIFNFMAHPTITIDKILFILEIFLIVDLKQVR